MVALLEREKSGKGQWVDTSLLQAQIFMLDFQAARWLIERRGAAAGRQQPPDLDPDRRLQDPDGYINIAAAGQQDLGARRARRSARPSSRSIRTTRPARRARRTATRSTPRSRSDTVQATPARLGRAAQQGRRAVRADLLDRPGVRRSAGAAPRHRARMSRKHEPKTIAWSASR